MTSTNELGAVPVLDGAVPRTITFKARENISGGQFVVLSGTGNNPVTSGANSFTSSDFEGALVNSDFVSGVRQINGIAIQDVASGAYGTIATRGAYIVKCGGSVFPGTLVEAVAPHAIQTIGSRAGGNWMYADGTSQIGRALTQGASGTNLYAIVDFNF